MFGKNKNEYEFYIATNTDGQYIRFNVNVFYSSSDSFKLIQSNQFYRSNVSERIRGILLL